MAKKGQTLPLKAGASLPAQLSAGLPSSRDPLPAHRPSGIPAQSLDPSPVKPLAWLGPTAVTRTSSARTRVLSMVGWWQWLWASPERQHKGAWATWTQRKGPSLPCAADSGSGFRGCARWERSLMPACKHLPLPQPCPSGHLRVTAHSPSRQMASFRKGEYPTARLHLWVPSRCYAENTFQTQI